MHFYHFNRGAIFAETVPNSFPHMATKELHEQESNHVGDGSSLSCHGVQLKAVDGILKTGDLHHSLVHSASYVATCTSRSCSVCKSPCKNYCTVCS